MRGRQKEHYIAGNFEYRGETFVVYGKISASSTSQSYYYACMFIKRIMGINEYFNFNCTSNNTMSSPL